MVDNNNEFAPVPIPDPRRNLGRYKIRSEEVAEAVKPLADHEASLFLWLHAFCADRDLSRQEMGALLAKPKGGGFYSYDSIYQALTGRRGAEGISLDNFIAAIERLRTEQRYERPSTGIDYIKTRLSDIIWERCDKVRRRNRIGFIFGDSQIGKSRNLLEYAYAHNHGLTTYFDCPPKPNFKTTVHDMCRARKVPMSNTPQVLADRVIDCHNDRMLIIVDNVHRLLRSRYTDTTAQVFDFFQHIFDAKGTGIIFSMTNEGRDLFLSGPQSKRLEQLWRRRLAPLQLPPVTPEDDLAKFAASKGLSPATEKPVTIELDVIDPKTGATGKKTHRESPLDLQARVNRDHGLGVWLNLLTEAGDFAKAQNRPITWGAVIKAHCMDQADSDIIV